MDYIRSEAKAAARTGSLSDLWEHLGRHAHNRAARMKLFIQAQENAR